MGQYFIFANLDKKEYISTSGSAKLTEHSYLENSTCLTVEILIDSGAWINNRVVHIGDYFKNDVFKDYPENLYNYVTNNFKKLSICDINKEYGLGQVDYRFVIVEHNGGFTDLIDSNGKKINSKKFRYIINLATKEWIDSYKLPPTSVDIGNDKIYFNKFDAFSFLICKGNEEGGGGTYCAFDSELVGKWADTSNNIYFSEKLPNGASLSGFTELKPFWTEADFVDGKLTYEYKTEQAALLNALKEYDIGKWESVTLDELCVYNYDLLKAILERKFKEAKNGK